MPTCSHPAGPAPASHLAGTWGSPASGPLSQELLFSTPLLEPPAPGPLQPPQPLPTRGRLVVPASINSSSLPSPPPRNPHSTVNRTAGIYEAPAQTWHFQTLLSPSKPQRPGKGLGASSGAAFAQTAPGQLDPRPWSTPPLPPSRTLPWSLRKAALHLQRVCLTFGNSQRTRSPDRGTQVMKEKPETRCPFTWPLGQQVPAGPRRGGVVLKLVVCPHRLGRKGRQGWGKGSVSPAEGVLFANGLFIALSNIGGASPSPCRTLLSLVLLPGVPAPKQ